MSRCENVTTFFQAMKCETGKMPGKLLSNPIHEGDIMHPLIPAVPGIHTPQPIIAQALWTDRLGFESQLYLPPCSTRP